MKESTKIIFFNIFKKSFDPALSLITKLQPQKDTSTDSIFSTYFHWGFLQYKNSFYKNP